MHESRKLYTVLYSDGNKPPILLLLSLGMVAVQYYDQYDRKVGEYIFSSRDDGRLFLNETRYWEYEYDTDEQFQKGTVVVYKESGQVFMTVADGWKDGPRFGIRPMPLTKDRYELTYDVSNFYLPYPEFGEYDYLLPQSFPFTQPIPES